jgi:hypothetical protein
MEDNVNITKEIIEALNNRNNSDRFIINIPLSKLKLICPDINESILPDPYPVSIKSDEIVNIIKNDFITPNLARNLLSAKINGVG